MFALEIDFHDGISSPETILVRRSNALVGTSDQAHVVVEGAPSGTPEIRLIRGLGAEFRCELARRSGQLLRSFAMLEGTYRRTAELKLGEVTLRVTVLDLDMALLAEEAPDRAAVRVLRSALGRPVPVFPAVAVVGPNPVFLSFPSDQPLLVGRSRKCGLRLDSVDVSGEHARFGVDAGKLWIEDLGSTNGTFVDGEQISGRHFLERTSRVSIGSGYILAPILGPEDVSSINRVAGELPPAQKKSGEEGFPCLVSLSDLVRPGRFQLRGQGTVRVGRDPASDLWINAPHISRQHMIIRWTTPEAVEVLDTSSNGTYLRGDRLPKNEPVQIGDGLAILDFCSGVTVALCHSLNEEALFVNRRAAPAAETVPESELEPETVEDESTFSDDEADYQPVRSRVDATIAPVENWENSVQLLGESGNRGPSVFEQLVERNRNQAKSSPEAASEEGGNPQTDEAHAYEHDLVQTGFYRQSDLALPNAPLGSGSHPPYRDEKEQLAALSGILDEVGARETLPEGVSADLAFEDQEYVDFDGQVPGERRVLRVVLGVCVAALFGVSVLLVIGLFSDSYFY